LNIFNIGEDRADFIFRILFCSIFLGLGFEHIFSDELIQRLMPDWIIYDRLASIICGIALITGGLMILIGYRIHLAAALLGLLLIFITAFVHGPGVMHIPESIPENSKWLWDIYQRSNLVKNLCLLGVCFWLLEHEPGKYSLDAILKR